MDSVTTALLEEALDLHRKGARSEAAARYQRVLRVEPRNSDALYHLARLACEEGRFGEGVDFARQALALARPQARARVHFLLGMALMRMGQGPQALEDFDRAIACQPDHADAHASRGDVLAELGRPVEAIASYGRALDLDPSSSETWCNRGAALSELGRFEHAVADYDRALALKPDFAEVHFNRAVALARMGRHDEALGSCDRALALRPDRADMRQSRAKILAKAGRHGEALADYDLILAAEPAHAATLMARGIALIELARLDEALACFKQLLAIEPGSADALNNRGFVLNALDRRDEALASYDMALRLDPKHADALNNRGVTLAEHGSLLDAIKSYDQALTVAPDHVGALCNRAKALYALSRFGEALASAERAARIDPNNAESLVACGDALARLGRHAQAIACFEQALALAPQHPLAAAAMVFSCLSVCDWDKEAKARRLLANSIEKGSAIVSPHLQLMLGMSAAQALTFTRRFVEHALPRGPSLPPAQPRQSQDRIRLAYLSGDFRRHPLGYLIPELLERHDRSRFEVIGVSFGRDDGSKIRARLVSAFDRFHDVTSASDHDAARFVRDLRVDVAIDLTCHSESARTGILAPRPAPIQVSYLGLIGTMGVDFVDYVLTDRFVVPIEEQPFYSEKVVYLPDCFMAADSRPEVSSRVSSRPESGLPAQGKGLVFASFNSSYKFRPDVFAIWMRLLRAVEGSVLWLLATNEGAVANLRREAERHGIEPTRLVFAPQLEHSEHFARVLHADLFLDTLPYNAHTTANDALWSGVPVLTCVGQSCAGRVAASQLHAIGMPELVTESLAEYEALALELATDPMMLRTIRQKLAQNRRTHPLFDTDRFRRHIETAYTTMCEISRRDEPPRSFSVAPFDLGKSSR